jgi:hypothetical protein
VETERGTRSVRDAAEKIELLSYRRSENQIDPNDLEDRVVCDHVRPPVGVLPRPIEDNISSWLGCNGAGYVSARSRYKRVCESARLPGIPIFEAPPTKLLMEIRRPRTYHRGLLIQRDDPYHVTYLSLGSAMCCRSVGKTKRSLILGANFFQKCVTPEDIKTFRISLTTGSWTSMFHP